MKSKGVNRQDWKTGTRRQTWSRNPKKKINHRILGLIFFVVFLELKIVNPDQFAVSCYLQFERGSPIDIDLHPEDGCSAPSVTLRTFYDAVSFLLIDRFSASQRQGIQRSVIRA